MAIALNLKQFLQHGVTHHITSLAQANSLRICLQAPLFAVFAPQKIFAVLLRALTLLLLGASSWALSEAPRATESVEESMQQTGLLRIYRSNILKLTYQHIVYPEKAIENNHEDDVVLRLIVDRQGNIEEVAFLDRARYNSLNRAARKAVLKAAPFPTAPNVLKGNSFELTIPVKFRLSN